MNCPLTLSVSTAPSESTVQELRQNLFEYNAFRAEPENYEPLLLILRDMTGKVMAGLSGEIYYQWLFIELIWVSEHIRGQGHGRMLLGLAEKEACSRRCRQVWLDTFTFQAPGFYEKQGYILFGELADYPPGNTRYFFRKKLDREIKL
jgi:ribosomal protein S18 acetylase RimI-like enzyme